MLRAVLYGVLLGCALILSAWMGMADAKSSGKQAAGLRITAPVKVEPVDRKDE